MTEKRQSGNGNGNSRGNRGKAYLRAGARGWVRPLEGSADEDPLHTLLVRCYQRAVDEALQTGEERETYSHRRESGNEDESRLG